MDRERAREYLKDQIEDYLQRQGLPTDGKTCFHCLNPQHEDKHPSMCYYKEARAVRCFSCHEMYDIFDLIGMDYGLNNYNDQLNKACEIYGITLDNNYNIFSFNGREGKSMTKTEPAKATAPAPAPKAEPEKDYSYIINASAQNRAEAVAYLESRGIDGTLAESFNIGLYKGYEDKSKGVKYQDESKRIWDALVIPVTKHNVVIRNTAPTEELEDKKNHRYRKLGEASLFGADMIARAKAEDRPLFICEGELDALSIMSVGGYAVGLGSADNADLFVRKAKAEKDKMPVIILALDNDDMGKTAEAKLLRELQGLGCHCYGDMNLYGKHKDANEALQQDKDSFIDTILQLQSEQDIGNYIALQESAQAHIQQFIDDIEKSKNVKPIKTGFKILDGTLDGGLFEGLYILGAPPSLGKTAIALQIADNVATAGNDVIFFTLEMSRKQIMARSISRNTYKLAVSEGKADRVTELGKNTREITLGSKWEYYSQEQKAHIIKAIETYSNTTAKHIYIHEGRGIGTKEIIERTERHIQLTGRKPLLVVDYLQIIKPEDTKADIRISTDNAVIALKHLSMKYGLAIILISSMNRMSYKSTTGMEGYRESSGIEYNCDVALALQYKAITEQGYNMEEEQSRDIRELVLRVSKNREGQSGTRLCMEYMPKYNFFYEAKDQEYMRNRASWAEQEDFQNRLKDLKRG